MKSHNYRFFSLILIEVFWFQKEGFPLFVLNESYTTDDRFELVRSSDDDWGLRIHDVREDDAGIYRCLLNTNPVQLKTLYLDVLGIIYHTLYNSDLKN